MATTKPTTPILIVKGLHRDYRVLPESERFWRHVDKTSETWSLVRGRWSRCWLWTGNTPGGRYGHFVVGSRTDGTRRNIKAHRWAFEEANGPVPFGLTLDHLCHQTRCVRPSHLEAVSLQDNILRGNTLAAENARKNACPRGHPYSGVNAKGSRICIICRREKDRQQKADYRRKNQEQYREYRRQLYHRNKMKQQSGRTGQWQ